MCPQHADYGARPAGVFDISHGSRSIRHECGAHMIDGQGREKNVDSTQFSDSMIGYD
jgi:hypothetical protein